MKIFLSGLFGAIFLIITEARAQEVGRFFHHLTAEQGLSQATNAYIYHDSRGFAWISSIDGLNRFDGLHTITYRSKAGQPRTMLGQNIQSNFFEAPNGDIWFCTYQAINCYRRRTDDFEHWQIADPISGDTIIEDYYAFHLDRAGKLWLRFGDYDQGRLALFDTQTGHIQHFGPLLGNRCFADTSANGRVDQIYSFFYGEGKKGLCRTQILANGQTKQTKLFDDGKNIFYDLFVDNQHFVWLAGNVGLTVFNPTTGLSTPYQCNASTATVSAMSVRSLTDTTLGVSTAGNGLCIFNLNQLSFTNTINRQIDRSSSLSSDTLNDLYVDGDHNLWISDWLVGVNFSNLDKPKFSNILLKNIDPSPGYIQAMSETKGGQIWCATSSGAIFIFDNHKFVRKVAQEAGLPESSIHWLYCDHKGMMWVISEGHGVFWYEENTARFYRVQGSEKIPLDFSPCLQESKDSTLLLSHQGFYRITPNTSKKGFYIENISVPGNVDSTQVRFYYQDKLGNFYFNINAAKTLIVRPNGETYNPALEDIKACYEDPNGQIIWIATTYGLAKIRLQDFKTLKIYDESNGLPNQYLYSVIPDREGFLWLSSNQGIFRFDPRDGTSRQYGAADGVWESEFFSNAWLCTSSGQIWMGNRDVINVFHPEAMHDMTVLPKIQITGLKVNDQDWHGEPYTYIGERTSLEFSYSENTLSFNFVALEYSDPANNRLQYFLEGYDRQWLDAPPGTPGFARYAKLPPGHYTLKIKAANSDGVWNPVPRELRIYIQTPFWQTWWFILLIVAAVVGTGYGIYRYRLAQIRKEYNLRQQTIESEMMALRAQMNPHFIFNSLNSINAYILRNAGKVASAYLTEFAHLMRQILDNSARETISLEDEIEFLQSYLRVEAMRLENKLAWHIQVFDEVDTFDTHIPSLILQPYVENAVWHGIAPKPEGGKIDIHIRREASAILLSIADNGIGRERARALRSSQAHTSKGLKITWERLVLYDQKQGTRSELNTIDLFDELGKAVGTRVEVRIFPKPA